MLVDDYDILAAGGTEPLRPLLPYLPSARDLRLHVLSTPAGRGRVARDVRRGAADASATPAAAALIMSGDRGEGQILPHALRRADDARPRPLRPPRRAPRIVQVAHFEAVRDAA